MNVNELEGAALDVAVGKAEGLDCVVIGNECLHVDRMRANADPRYRPSVLWAEGGPIIERERISIEAFPGDLLGGLGWMALHNETFDGNCDPFGTIYRGPTPLIAAMRAYVASKQSD